MWILGLYCLMRFQKTLIANIKAELEQHRFLSELLQRHSWCFRCCTDGRRSRFFHTYCRRQQSCCYPGGGGCRIISSVSCCKPPQPCLDQSMLLHLQAMSCPAGAVVPWRATKKHTRLPLPLDPPLFHFFLILFLNISALNYTSSLIKRKLTNTWYFLFSCRSTVDSAF